MKRQLDLVVPLESKAMNVEAAGLVGILIYRMLVMQRIKGICDTCFREYSLELMIAGKNAQPDYCIRCFNRGSRHMVDEPMLKLREVARLREEGTRIKAQALFSKTQGSSSRKK
tara:strand:- start:140 stop:481 length:342 start_codon:yes stop_codon:yes gene_type:complete